MEKASQKKFPAMSSRQSTTKTKGSQTEQKRGLEEDNGVPNQSVKASRKGTPSPPPPPPPPSAPPTCTFENVSYKGWNTSHGRIVLSKPGFLYQAPTDDGRKLKFRWGSMSAPPKINQEGSRMHMLKIHIGDSDPHVFKMKDRADLELAKAEISSRMKSSSVKDEDKEGLRAKGPLKASNNTSVKADANNTSINADASNTTLITRNVSTTKDHSNDELHTYGRTKREGNSSTYANVSYGGHDGGHIVLTENAFSYYGPQGNGHDDVHLEWKSICKHKINAASQKMPLIRIVSFDRHSYIFRMKDRIVLERIKKDVKERRVAAARYQVENLKNSNQTGQTQLSSQPSSRTSKADSPKRSPLRQSHGANRRQLQPVNPTLGSFGRLVGPAADIRELEYVSCLHQNVELLLRSDGTISSQDIIPYLASRYGVTITPDQAVDIACNLCGAKPRNEFSAERDVRNDELRNPDQSAELLQDDDEDDDEEEVYYFDLVQATSLLMIPELLQLSDQHCTLAGQQKHGKREASSFVDLSSPVSFLGEEADENGSLRLSDKAVGTVQVVIESLIEIFDEDLRNDIRRGMPLDADSMRTILESFGDVDGSNDQETVQQMLDALGKDSPVLSLENLLRAVTSDVQTYPRPGSLKEDEKITLSTRSSMFHDVFGFNWDNDTREKDKDKEEIPKTFATASFIDYAADTYRSVLHNTSVWCLFILTTLIYLNFFITMIQGETGGLLCPNDKSFGCTVGNKIIGWIITAIFCGFYGLFFILPTSMGNVQGKTLLLLLTLIITAVFTYAPFTTLIWYRQGVPHNVNVTHDYRIVCPAWIDPATAQTVFNNETLDTTQYYLYLDDSCLTQVEWCEMHPEVQGKYLDEAPEFLTYDEFEKCYNFLSQTVLEDFDLWTITGNVCDPNNLTAVCPGYGPCALRDLNEGSPYVCCHSGTSAFFETEDTYDEVCDMQPPGAPCVSSDMCESFICENNVCGSAAGAADANTTVGKELGASCGRSNAACKSGFCNPTSDKCELNPLICPVEFLEFLGGFRLDPFCRTLGDWCVINDVNELVFNMFEWGFQVEGEDACTAVLDGFLELSETVGLELVKVIDPSEAEIGYTDEFVQTNAVEDVLLDPWAYFILLCIAIVGAFALMAMIRGLASNPKNDDRPRDYRIKCAASYKVANLIENALSMHMVEGASTKGQVMRNYFLNGEQVVEVGGLFWTLKGILSGKIYSEEGVRYTGRIWIGQVTQVVVTIIGVAYAIEFVKSLANEIDETRKDLNDHYTPDEVKEISNYEWPALTRDDLTVSEEEQTILDTMPEKWMIEAAGYPAVVVGTLVAIFCILVYVPSYTNTVLKLRSGMIPSLHDPHFGEYRNTADNVVPNIGNMVFSLMGAAAFTGSLVFVIVFLFAWPQTRETVLGYLAVVIGIVCTLVIKIVGQKLLRARNFSSFYRKRPGSANYANLFFECWYLGTSLLVVVKRLITFLVMGALWLGRVDTDFLHPSVKLFGKNLDKLPEAFRKDLLVHEAHSHPFIERLGQMYLLRLRDGDNFGSVAGTHWRCLFVSGLMPWIVKYKVNTNDSEFQ